MLGYFILLLKSFMYFTGSYSVNVFPDALSNDMEEEYINKNLLGDKDARCKLIEHNLRLVAHIVKKYDASLYDPDDLISIGTIGLVKAIDSYKPSKLVKLTTYAARCIENEILMHLRSNKKHLACTSMYDVISVDKDGSEVNLIDILKDDNKDNLDVINNQDNIKLLHEYLNVLSKRERDIIIKRYGLYNEDELTQKDISKRLNISRSYVSRIEKRALGKILKEFKKRHKEL